MLQRIGFIRDSEASWRYTCRSFTRKTLRRSRVFLRVDHWSETATHQRWQKDRLQHGELRTDCCLSCIDWLFQISYPHLQHHYRTRLQAILTLRQASTRSESASSQAWRPVDRTNRNRKHNQKWGQLDSTERPVAWLARMVGKFTEHLLDERVPAYRDTPASS